MRGIAGLCLLVTVAGCASAPERSRVASDASGAVPRAGLAPDASGRARLASDAPEAPRQPPVGFTHPASYQRALEVWRTPEDVSVWMGARFEYDRGRALQLSETRRGASGTVAIHRPEELFATPAGVCVDLARFAVETLRRIAPDTQPRYLMIEFAPVTVDGHTLRRHWVATFTRGGRLHVFADSKRPGHVAGPYASIREFVEAYAAYRGRPVVAVRELDSYARQPRAVAARQLRQESVRPGRQEREAPHRPGATTWEP